MFLQCLFSERGFKGEGFLTLSIKSKIHTYINNTYIRKDKREPRLQEKWNCFVTIVFCFFSACFLEAKKSFWLFNIMYSEKKVSQNLFFSLDDITCLNKSRIGYMWIIFFLKYLLKFHFGLRFRKYYLIYMVCCKHEIIVVQVWKEQ